MAEASEYEQNEKIWCDHCAEDGQSVEAQTFCFNCKKYYCSDCERHHLKFFRDHMCVSERDMPNQGKETTFLSCEIHPVEKIEFYCKGHENVFCKICKMLKHAKCEVQLTKASCNDPDIEGEVNHISKVLSDWKKSVTKIEQQTLTCLDHQIKEQETHRSNIQGLRTELISFFDKYETQLDLHYNPAIEDLKTKLSVCTSFNKLVGEHVKSSADAKDKKEREQMLIILVKAKLFYKEYQNCIDQMSAEFEVPKDFVYYDESLARLISRLEGILDTEHTSSEEILENNRAATAKGFSFWSISSLSLMTEAVVMKQEKEKQPYISGCCVVADNQFLLCDSVNQKVFLFDRNLGFKNAIECANAPFDIGVIDTKSVVVTIPKSMEIQYIIVYPVLRSGKRLTLNVSCYGVAVHEQRLYVCASDAKTKEQSIKILSQTGTELKTLPVSKSVHPRYICLNKDASRIYYTSNNSSHIRCISSEGDPIFSYSEFQIEIQSITADAYGDVLACDSGKRCLRVVRAKGDNGTDLHITGSYRPSSLCYDRLNNVILAASNNQEEVKLCLYEPIFYFTLVCSQK